jgi:hypothetical protein
MPRGPASYVSRAKQKRRREGKKKKGKKVSVRYGNPVSRIEEKGKCPRIEREP